MTKNTSYKSCSELNFLQKSQLAHISIFPGSGARGLQRLMCLKYYNLLKWKLDQFKGTMLSKLPIITKNISNKSCLDLNFLQKSQ